jgi:hypothetical protein
MTDTHVVSALKEKRTQVASQIESLQGQLRQATKDLDHVEAPLLRLFVRISRIVGADFAGWRAANSSDGGQSLAPDGARPL